MQTIETDHSLDRMWARNSDYLRRLLISMTRDLDLADDLLQEAYLRAHSGIAGYRGGDECAWLAAIVRSAFLSHIRRRHVREETPLDSDQEADVNSMPGSRSHLGALDVRQAIEGLSPVLRDALVLRHFGSLTYPEIAERLGCPVGTAKRRVWDAMQRLRVALSPAKEAAQMTCSDIRGTRLLDYLYGSLSAEESAAMEAHLAECPPCREEADALRTAVSALEEFRDTLILYDLYEVCPDGSARVYGTIRRRNNDSEASTKLVFGSMKYNHADAMFSAGQELRFESRDWPDDPDMNEHTVYLKNPIQPGEYADIWYVFHTGPGGPNAAEDLGNDRWRYMPDSSRYTGGGFMRILTVRLPEGARLENSTQPPDKITSDGTVTLTWCWLVEPGGKMFDRPIIEYTI